MNKITTPEKINWRLQPGQIAMHLKWQSTDIHRGLTALFTGVKVLDLQYLDFSLPDMNIKYFSEDKLVGGVDFSRLQDIGRNVVVIADRNTLTAQMFSQVQEHLLQQGMSLLPVGHMKEIPLLLYQLYLAENVQSPGSNFRTSSKLPSNAQQTLLLSIPGLGPIKAKKLLETFGTVLTVGHAALEDLVSVVGESSANQVFKFFNKVTDT